MKHGEIIAYLEAIKTSQKTITQNNSIHRCPCCGEPIRDVFSISYRFEDIFICSSCRTKESLAHRTGTWNASPEALTDWWIIKTQEMADPFPSDPVLFHIMDPEVNDDKTITFLCECWFDQAKKFGLDPAILADEDTWLNVYLTIHPQTREISMCYTVDDNKKNESFVYVPTKADRDAILYVVDHYCRRRRETLQDIVDSVLPATEEEQEFEIPVKEINYGVAKIRAASLDAARAKIHEAYESGNIVWTKTEFDFLPMGGADNG